MNLLPFCGLWLVPGLFCAPLCAQASIFSPDADAYEFRLFDVPSANLPLPDSLAADMDFSPVDELQNKKTGTVERMKLNRDYVIGFLTDIKDTYAAPFHWKGGSWLKLGLITAVGTVLYYNDDGFMRWIQRNHTETTDDIAKVAEYMGNYMYVIPGVVVLYGYGKLFKDGKARETALLAAKCAGISFLVVHTIKFLTGRHRPTADGTGSSTIWDGPGGKLSESSFPSGHSAIAFSFATVFATQYSKKWFQVLCYSGAVLTALSRIHDRRHWASDVLIGSLLGYFISKGLMNRKFKKDQGLLNRIQVMPMIGGNSFGVSMNLSF